MMKTVNIRLKHKELSKSGEVSYLLFDIDKDFEFREGQYFIFKIEFGGKRLKKAFSIATTQKQCREKGEIGFFVKKINEGGTSQFLTEYIKEGDEITASGPFGTFYDDFTLDNYLLVSVGSGLGPILGHYDNLLEKNNYSKVVNIFGERYEDNIPNNISKKFDFEDEKIKNILYLSRQEDISNRYRKGYVQDAIKEAIDFIGDKNIKTFLCGKPEMVEHIEDLLRSNGIDPENIFLEKY